MGTNDNYKQYAQLRTILDSLEIGALRFYLNAADPIEQAAHFDYIKEKTKPILEHFWGRNRDDTCPEGYHDCDGCCVPYNCMGGIGPGPSKK